MNSSNQKHRVFALAGLIQAATLVKQLSTVGRCDESALETSIHSIFTLDAPTVEAIYGGPQNLRIGLQELIKLFTHNKEPKDSDIARYLLSLIHLERKLSKNLLCFNPLKKA